MACTDPCDCPPLVIASVDPTVTDDDCAGNCPGQLWYNDVDETFFRGVTMTPCGSADWKQTGGTELNSIWFGGLGLATQSIPSNVATTLNVSEDFNNNPSADVWDNGMKTLTIGNSGVYVFGGSIVAQNVPADFANRIVTMQIIVNSVFAGNIIGMSTISIDSGTATVQGQGTSQPLILTASDVVKIKVFQNFSVAITLDDSGAGGNTRNSWSMFRVPARIAPQ